MFAAPLVQELGGVRADVAEPLDGRGALPGLEPKARHRLEDRVDDAATGRLLAPGAAAKDERLARDEPGRVLPAHAVVLVEHPAHDARVGVHVRRRDVELRPEHGRQAPHVAARQLLELARR
jgi:hypothetical protein